MKKTAVFFCVFILISLATAVCAADGSYSCAPDLADFNGKVFDNLTINTSGCDGVAVSFENITC